VGQGCVIACKSQRVGGVPASEFPLSSHTTVTEPTSFSYVTPCTLRLAAPSRLEPQPSLPARLCQTWSREGSRRRKVNVFNKDGAHHTAFAGLVRTARPGALSAIRRPNRCSPYEQGR